MKAITIEECVEAIEVDWEVAHQSPTEGDWDFRWTALRFKIEGVQAMCIQLSVNTYDDVRDDLHFLWQIALQHHMNWGHLS